MTPPNPSAGTGRRKLTTMRRMRKQPTGPRNDRDFSAEAGDRVYWEEGNDTVMFDLRESTGWRKRTALGELTPHLVKKNGKPRLAKMNDHGVWYWLD